MAVTYTWNNSTRNLSTTTAWTPTRSSPLGTDILIIAPDTAGHTPNTGSATCATCAISANGIDGGTIVGAVTHTAGHLVGTFSDLTIYSDAIWSNASFSPGARLAFVTHGSTVPGVGTGEGSLTNVTTLVSDGDLMVVQASDAADQMDLSTVAITIAGNFSAVATPTALANGNQINLDGTVVTTTGSLKNYTLFNVDGSPTMVGFANGAGGGGRMSLSL